MTKHYVVLAIFLFTLLSARVAASQDRCSARPIDPLGAEGAFVTGLNNWGQVIGNLREADGHDQPFLWQLGVTRRLPLLADGSSGFATAINDLGRIVGVSVAADDTRTPVVWTARGVRALRTTSTATPMRINVRGQIIGNTYGSCMFWESGDSEASELFAPGGGRCQFVALNDRGEALGYFEDASGRRVFRYRAGAVQELPTPSDASGTSYVDLEPTELNNLGLAVGSALAADGTTRPVVWTAGGEARVLELAVHAQSLNDWGALLVQTGPLGAVRQRVLDPWGRTLWNEPLGGPTYYVLSYLNERFQVAWSSENEATHLWRSYFCQLRE